MSQLPKHDEQTVDAIEIEIAELRFKKAESMFSGLSARDARAKQLQRLASNMVAAQQFRPTLYNQLCVAIEQGQLNTTFKPVAARDWETVAHQHSNGQLTLDNPEDNPEREARQLIEDHWGPIQQDQAVALAGLQDGYLLTALARLRSPFADGRVLPVFVLETNPGRILACFQIHNWSGEEGPLARAQFEWCGGSDWSFELRSRLNQDTMIPLPRLVMGDKRFEREILQFSAEIDRHRTAQARDKYVAHHERRALLSPKAVAKALLEKPSSLPSPPRAALVGSRFQPESRELCEQIRRTLTQDGWKVSSLMEQEAHQRLTADVIRDRVSGVDPTVVVSVCNPLVEGRDVVSPHTPTILWGEVPAAAAAYDRCVRITSLEPLSHAHVVLGDRALVVPLPFPEPLGPSPLSTPTGTPHLAIFADAPVPPAQILKDSIQACHPGTVLSELVETIGTALMERYDKGSSLSSPGQMDALLDKQAGETSTGARQEAGDRLWTLNKALYLLHTINWAAKAAKQAGGELRVYGAGWETFPQVAPSAKPAPSSRESRSRAMQTATACIHATPGFCLTSGLMQGIADGGFHLLRDHPLNDALPDLAAALVKLAPNARSEREALATMAPEQRENFKRLCDRLLKFIPQVIGADPVALVRSCARSGILDAKMQPLPHLPETRFGDAEELAAKLTHFHDNRAERLTFVREQQAALQERLGMQAILRRASTLLARRFAAGADDTPRVV